MGLYSSLGPIDPQVSGAAAHAILEEFREIKATYARTPKEAAAWVPILNKYTPTLIGNCEKAIKLAQSIVGTWLETNMFAGKKDRQLKARKVLNALGSHKKTLSHGRHINIEEARKLDLIVSLGLSEIAEQCGFASSDVMTRRFRFHLKVKPLDYRARFRSSIGPAKSLRKGHP